MPAGHCFYDGHYCYEPACLPACAPACVLPWLPGPPWLRARVPAWLRLRRSCVAACSRACLCVWPRGWLRGCLAVAVAFPEARAYAVFLAQFAGAANASGLGPKMQNFLG